MASKCFIAVLLVLVVTGCVSSTSSQRLHPDQQDSLGGTGIDSPDVRTVAQRMARAIVASPGICDRESPARVLILPVRNRTRFRIDTEVFTVLIRDILIENAGGKVRFLDRFSSSSPGENEKSFMGRLGGVDYFLRGELHSISKSTGAGVSDWVVYSFTLVDRVSSEIVLSKSYETKKEGILGVVYR
jgi:hypothetical protein